MKKIFLTALITALSFFNANSQSFEPLQNGISSSFRGISTVSKQSVWVSGSNGSVGFSLDAGKSWKWVNPKGYEKYDFRDIKAFSGKEAVIMSSGTPTVILRTSDAGKTWKEVFKEENTAVFLDDMIFEGKTGYILGDPIDGKFQLLKSKNKGKTWTNISDNFMLFADEGEAAFAASGSNMVIFGNKLYIGTGGKYSSFFNYNPKGLQIDKYDVPIWSGINSAGIFAIDFINENEGIAVGGDYMNDKDNRNNVVLTKDAGKTWSKPATPVLGYRSDVLYIDHNTIVTTGTSGTDISYDAGQNWKNLSDLSFNAIAKDKAGKHIYLIGSKGNIYKLLLK